MTAGELVIFIILSGILQGLIAAMIFSQAVKKSGLLRFTIDLNLRSGAARARLHEDEDG
ncbi:MAG: hypothetical protein R3E60_06655 [Alphaproteobacteria bacterium]